MLISLLIQSSLHANSWLLAQQLYSVTSLVPFLLFWCKTLCVVLWLNIGIVEICPFVLVITC